MSNPTLQAFFLGRALATAIGEKVEEAITTGMSGVGRFDAEQREWLHRFVEDVFEQAQSSQAGMDSETDDGVGEDLQATIDNLRAEIAQVRVALQQYRSS
ncbi:hypothetical protein D0962_08435 [Leptolyngbyaceae cyanobacterium CCMR0082]|uniref:Thylakoid lumen protein n=2 Tax=Adonisia turfae TaxID=2950184 RepID=A0A6M0S332_9CYAN|nr:hypothetical protein [Adonisia turfae]EKV01396.1 hypothetical protein Lepto7375DRAFT_3565 [Leptolyngbya sp. PCC 7375]MDV3349392.1 hypothetical protein [Leptothoe sp. LEGE 181152]NEZ58301.1 hypothetical protein [Adonisia turfae CCMR0081]NEZ62806.1 hypothetical protein [Adonisia turfae CCMR0082]